MFDLFNTRLLYGTPEGMRPLSQNELAALQAQLHPLMQNSNCWMSYMGSMAQYEPPNRKPLDERFAEFKVRLAKAVESRKRLS